MNQTFTPDLSIVIPALNEQERIGKTLDEIAGYIRKKNIPAEIIVVSDGSRDRTAEVVRAREGKLPGLSLVEFRENRGKGFAVRTGIEKAGGRWVLFSDADHSTPIEEFDRFLPFLESGFSVVIGSRALPDSRIEIHQNRIRETMGKSFNFLVQSLVISGLKDTQCGFKAFEREAIRKIISFQRVERFGFDVEILYLAEKLGYSIHEVPVRWINSPQSRVRIMRDSSRMILDLLRIRWLDLRGMYEERK
jgi:dolichyl-phosphate beta-glucosyltransferase